MQHVTARDAPWSLSKAPIRSPRLIPFVAPLTPLTSLGKTPNGLRSRRRFFRRSPGTVLTDRWMYVERRPVAVSNDWWPYPYASTRCLAAVVFNLFCTVSDSFSIARITSRRNAGSPRRPANSWANVLICCTTRLITNRPGEPRSGRPTRLFISCPDSRAERTAKPNCPSRWPTNRLKSSINLSSSWRPDARSGNVHDPTRLEILANRNGRDQPSAIPYFFCDVLHRISDRSFPTKIKWAMPRLIVIPE